MKKKATKGKISLSKRQRDRLIQEFGHIPTKEEIFTKLEASLARMTEALQGAWETMPDKPEIREQMTKAVSGSAKLREGIYKKVLKKDVPPSTPASRKSQRMMDR